MAKNIVLKNFTVAKLCLATFIVMLGSIGTVQAITVSPAIYEVTVEPGETKTGVIKITNEEDEDKTLYTSMQNFEPRGESGTPYFIGAEDGLATWIEVQGEVLVASDKSVEVPYTIIVPNDAKPGGYFAAVFFGTQKPVDEELDQETQVSIGGKVGVLILLRVAGEIPEKGGIADFGTEGGKMFFVDLPVKFEYRFSNDGGDRVVPVGDILVKNIFGIKKETFSVNEALSNVLPGSVRKFEYIWKNKEGEPEVESKNVMIRFLDQLVSQWNTKLFGVYKAEINLAWGINSDKTDTDFVWLVFVPWQLILIVGIIIGFLVKIVKFYNKFLIKNAIKSYKKTEMKNEIKPSVASKKKKKTILKDED